MFKADLPLKCLPLHIVLPHKFDNLLLSFTTVPTKRKWSIKICTLTQLTKNMSKIKEFNSVASKVQLCWHQPEGRTSTQNTGFLPWNMFYNWAAKEAMVFYALFPKIFAFISTFKEKFYCVFVVTLEVIT